MSEISPERLLPENDHDNITKLHVVTETDPVTTAESDLSPQYQKVLAVLRKINRGSCRPPAQTPWTNYRHAQ